LDLLCGFLLVWLLVVFIVLFVGVEMEIKVNTFYLTRSNEVAHIDEVTNTGNYKGRIGGYYPLYWTEEGNFFHVRSGSWDLVSELKGVAELLFA